MKAISTPHAPGAIGPYSQAISAGGFVFLSGQIPLNPKSGVMIRDEEGFQDRAKANPGGQVALETEQVMRNLQAVLEAAGLSFKNVVRSTIFLSDLSHFAVVNEIYAKHFTEGPPPARATVQVAALPRASLVEIDMIAHAG